MVKDDVRARRAERVRADKMKNFIPLYGKYILAAVLIVAAVGAAATLYHPPAAKKFAHEHPAFAIFADGEQLDFNDPAYDASRISDKVHIHYNGDPARASTWHVEANFPNGIPDISLQAIFTQYGVQFREGSYKEDTYDSHQGRTFADSGNETWRVYVSKQARDDAGNPQDRQPYVELVPGSPLLPEGPARDGGDYSAYVPRDLDKILLTYGSDEAAIAAQQDQVPDPRP